MSAEGTSALSALLLLIPAALAVTGTWGLGSIVWNGVKGVTRGLHNLPVLAITAIIAFSLIVLWLLTVTTFFALPIVLNYVMLKPIRNQGYGLASTFFAAPSAPPWTKLRKNVIALPISFGITTLSFGMVLETQLEPLVQAARAKTCKELSKIEAEWKRRAETNPH